MVNLFGLIEVELKMIIISARVRPACIGLYRDVWIAAIA